MHQPYHPRHDTPRAARPPLSRPYREQAASTPAHSVASPCPYPPSIPTRGMSCIGFRRRSTLDRYA
uniref:Uncharacterized protein n=1 Tax=uncultured marine virus TaxID=186617 RepID=A0A0F7L257_9VIRU|nr:hypothetical protein [uncultured marine virus]